MESGPFISVVIPVFRVEEYVQNTLESLLGQSFQNFEIVLVDDGSPDNSIEIAREILSSSINYKVITQKNSGQGIARNTGLAEASGEWVFFLDSDDVIQPFTFSGFKEIVDSNPTAEMVFSRFQMVGNSDLWHQAEYSTACSVLTRNEMLRGFLRRSIVPLVPGSFYRKDYLTHNAILHSGIRWSEDQEFMWKVLSRINCAVSWDCITYNYCRHGGSTMTSAPISTVIEAYSSFLELPPLISDETVQRFLVPRWVLGCLHSFAKRSNYEDWKTLYYALNSKKWCKELRSFPSVKVRVLAWIGAISPRMAYRIMGDGKNAG